MEKREERITKEQWKKAVREGGERILDLLYPPRCPVCGQIAPVQTRIHPACRKELSVVREPRCKKCSKPIDSMEKEFCYDCEKKTFSYERGWSLWLYQGAAAKCMAQFKYQNKREYGIFFCRELAETLGREIRTVKADALVPVPVHPSRWRKRGYNQAEVLAQGLSRELQIPVRKGDLIRVKKTTPQKKLNDRERLRNLTGAFQMADRPFPAAVRRVILVDDIYTTGSTIEACAGVLLAAGVRQVYFVTVCIGTGF